VTRTLAASLWCIALLGCNGHIVNGGTPKIEGQVFVATAGGQSYKLGDVTVYVYSLSNLQKYLADRAKAANHDAAVLSPIVDEGEKDVKEAERVEKEAESAWISSRGQDTDRSEKAFHDAEADADKVRDLYQDAQHAQTYTLSGLFYFDGLSKQTDIPVVASARTDADGKFSIELPADTTGDIVLAARAERRVVDSTEAYCWMLRVDEEDRKTKINLANATMSSGNDPHSLIHTVSAEDEAIADIGKEALERFRKLGEEHKRKVEEAEKAKEAAEMEKKAQFIREHFASLVGESQARAIAKHPELGKAGSPLNIKFVDTYKDLKAKQSPRLQEPDWPERLAEECAKTP
jgi:hypothetical protein